MTDWHAEFGLELDRQLAATASPFPQEDWLAAGWPRQDEKWWREHGPDMCRTFADWYQSQPGIRIWTAPDGRPAIELDLTVAFGQVPVKMAPDLVLAAGSALVVLDLKSGSAESNKPRQLGLYACGVELAYGIRPRYGTFFMTKGVPRKNSEERAYFLPPIDLGGPEYSVGYFTREFATFNRAVDAGIFLANPDKKCQTCGVSGACAAFGGEQAAVFDPSHPAYQGRIA